MYCTGLHNPLLGTNEVSGNALVANQHLKCHRTGVSVTVILTSPVFSHFSGLGLLFFLFTDLSLELNFCSLIIVPCLNSILDLNCKYAEVLKL
jgi:hypothetical protein